MVTRWGSIFSSARAIWIVRRMPKSPHPGHQSLWTSVAKSEGFRICSRATGQHRPLRGLPADDILDRVVQFRVGHRAAVVLQDEVGHLDAAVLSDDARELRPEVHLDPDPAFRFREVREDLRGRERVDQANMEVADLRALGPESVQCVQERALRRPPAHDDGGRVLRTEVPQLDVARDFLRREVELGEPLLHHRIPDHRVLRDVAPLLVLVAGVPENRPLLTQEGARGDGTVAQVEPLVRIVFGVTVVLEGESTPVDPEIGEVRNRRRGVAVRERLVDEMDDWHLVSVRVVEGQEPVADALLEVPRREENPRALAVARMEGEPEVALLVAARHPGARAGALVQRDHDRHFVDRCPTDPLHHEGKPGARRGRRGASTSQGGARRHRDGRDLVFGLDDEDGGASLLRRRGTRGLRSEPAAIQVEHLVLLEELTLVRRRGDGIVCLESHPAVQLPEGGRLAAGEEEPRLRPRELLESVRELRHEGLRDVVRLPRACRVHVHDLRLRTEYVLEGAAHHLEVEPEDAEGGADREHVHDAGDLAQLVDLELVRDLLEEVLEWNRHEADAALLRGGEHVVERLADPAGDQVRLQVGGEPRLDRRNVREARLSERRIVDDRAIVGDLAGVPEQGLRLERREYVDVVDVRPDEIGVSAECEVGVLAHDVRIEFALPEDVQAAGGARAREDVRGRVDAAPLRTSDHPGEVVYLRRGGTHRIMPPSRPKAGAFLGLFQFPIRREEHTGRPALHLVHGSAWSEHEARDARAPYQTFPPDSAGQNSFAAFLRRTLRRRADFRGATPRQDELLHEALHELEAVAERHLTDARDLRDRLLRAALPARQGREVNRGRRGPRTRQGHRAVDLLEFFEDLLGLGLDRVRQAEPRAEPAHVVRRPGGRDAQHQCPQEGAIRFADRLLADARHLLQLI